MVAVSVAYERVVRKWEQDHHHLYSVCSTKIAYYWSKKSNYTASIDYKSSIDNKDGRREQKPTRGLIPHQTP
jgi:hypothetical protein